MPITLHSHTQGNNSSVSTISWSHTGPSTPGLWDMVLVITGIFQNSAPTVTYGGQACTEIAVVAFNNLRCFYRLNPLGGTQTVQMTVGSAISYMHGICLYLQGVDTSNPIAAGAINSITHGDTGGPRTLSVAANVNPYHYVVSAFQFSNGTYLSVSGAPLIRSSGARLHVAGEANDDTPDTPRTVAWTYNNQPDTYQTFALSVRQKVLGAQFAVGGVMGL